MRWELTLIFLGLRVLMLRGSSSELSSGSELTSKYIDLFLIGIVLEGLLLERIVLEGIVLEGIGLEGIGLDLETVSTFQPLEGPGLLVVGRAPTPQPLLGPGFGMQGTAPTSQPLAVEGIGGGGGGSSGSLKECVGESCVGRYLSMGPVTMTSRPRPSRRLRY